MATSGQGTRGLLAVILGGLCLLVACAPAAQAPPAAAGPPTAEPGSAPHGTLRLAWAEEPNSLHSKFLTGAGNGDYDWLFNSALSFRDQSGVAHPMMAQVLPSQENGDWVVNPDGTMLTTYRLRPDVHWHDGVPLTAADFVFGFQIWTDFAIPVQDRRAESRMASVVAQDDQTFVVTWKQLYVGAGQLGYRQLSPLPRHLLETKYQTDKTNFASGPEWTTSYMGSGPFRLVEWNPGANLVAEANPAWFLGSPRIARLDIRFVPDANAELADLLAGDVDMINSPGIRSPQAVTGRDQWAVKGEGYLRSTDNSLGYVEFQYRDVPDHQRAVLDVRVRQALLYGIDRQGLVDTVSQGLGGVANAFMTPTDALFDQLDAVVPKYPYDPARALALLAEAGWQRAGDGGLLVDPSGRTLDLRLDGSSQQGSTMTIVADNWKSLGINPSIFIVPQPRERDQEFRSQFPGAGFNSRTISPDNFIFTSDNLPTPANAFVGSNRGSFVDPEVDRLHIVTLTSLSEQERDQATIDMNRRLFEVAGIGPLIYNVDVILAKSTVQGPVGAAIGQEGLTWNVQDWTLAG